MSWFGPYILGPSYQRNWPMIIIICDCVEVRPEDDVTTPAPHSPLTPPLTPEKPAKPILSLQAPEGPKCVAPQEKLVSKVRPPSPPQLLGIKQYGSSLSYSPLPREPWSASYSYSSNASYSCSLNCGIVAHCTKNLMHALNQIGLTWVYLECGTCSFIYFDLIDWQCVTCLFLNEV